MSQYKLLFTPLQLGPVTLRNRVVFSAHLTNFAERNRPGPRLVESLEILAEVLHPQAFRFGHEGSGWKRME